MVAKVDLDLVLRRLFALQAPKVPCGNGLSHSVTGVENMLAFQLTWWPGKWAAEAFITAILLLSWTDVYAGRDLYEVVDYFAGAARVARIARAAGMKAAALDLNYHRKPRTFSMNSSPGFVCLGRLVARNGMTQVLTQVCVESICC